MDIIRGVALCVLIAGFGLRASAAEVHAEINEKFSGNFEVTSCEPGCNKIEFSDGRGWSFNFDGARALQISLVDNLSPSWKTCGQFAKPFEFNIWVHSNKTGSIGLPFMHNNLEADRMNPWENICDAKLTVTTSTAALQNSQILIELTQQTPTVFSLKWKDTRGGLSGVFLLRKI